MSRQHFIGLIFGVLLFISADPTWAQSRRISGKVTAPDGRPLTIASSSGSAATLTDSLGRFTLSAMPADIITLSATGYRTVAMPASSDFSGFLLNAQCQAL
jgi:hypothetical protein